MEIKYLQLLRDNPEEYPKNKEGRKHPIEPFSIVEIEQLESAYNSGKKFPLALRELLFLAGNSCYVLEYGYKGNMESVQRIVWGNLARESKVMPRPFLAIDIYNMLDQFLFVFLDEGDDPPVYEGYYSADYWEGDNGEWYRKIQPTLSIYINRVVTRVQAGGSAF